MILMACSQPDLIITDDAGAPIVGAEVVGVSLSVGGQKTLSDQGGRARVPGASQETLAVSVHKPGYISQLHVDVSQPKPISVVLQRE